MNLILTERRRSNNARVHNLAACGLLLCGIMWFAVFSAWSAPAPAQSAEAEAINARMEALQAGEALAIGGTSIAAWQLLPRLYASRSFMPLWPDEKRIAELLALLETAPQHGLDTADYGLESLRSVLARATLSGNSFDLADLDILATEALVRFGYHLRFGKVNPASQDAHINFRRELLRNPLQSIPALIDSPLPLAEQFAANFPFGPIYRSLQRVLADYVALEAAGGWPAVGTGPSLHPGDTDSRLPSLRARLRVTGELSGSADHAGDNYDAALVEAVRMFQRRHGLDDDGVVGAQTIAAANVSVQARIDQLRLSLERLRWVQKETGDDFLVVNIAGFRAFLFRDGVQIWNSRVMVGTPYRQTPVFRDDIRYLEINPTWTVPPTILTKDILPRVKTDPGYLDRQNIQVIDREGRIVDPATIDWSRYTRGVPYTLRQQPGPGNALGRVKFMFPNEHLVFVHDTPSRTLFGRAERAFSSGCIRLERPFELAELLLNDMDEWNAEKIEAVVAGGKTRRVNLPKPEPILILYLTASIDADDRPVFFRDVYERDARLLAALNGPVAIDLPGI